MPLLQHGGMVDLKSLHSSLQAMKWPVWQSQLCWLHTQSSLHGWVGHILVFDCWQHMFIGRVNTRLIPLFDCLCSHCSLLPVNSPCCVCWFSPPMLGKPSGHPCPIENCGAFIPSVEEERSTRTITWYKRESRGKREWQVGWNSLT